MFAEDVVDVDDGCGVTDLGVKGVMEHSPAIELLYKLIARWNLIIVVENAMAFEITQNIMVISSSSNLERVKHDDSKNRVRLAGKKPSLNLVISPRGAAHYNSRLKAQLALQWNFWNTRLRTASGTMSQGWIVGWWPVWNVSLLNLHRSKTVTDAQRTFQMFCWKKLAARFERTIFIFFVALTNWWWRLRSSYFSSSLSTTSQTTWSF